MSDADVAADLVAQRWGDKGFARVSVRGKARQWIGVAGRTCASGSGVEEVVSTHDHPDDGAAWSALVAELRGTR